jgi:hypothetical protein
LTRVCQQPAGAARGARASQAQMVRQRHGRRRWTSSRAVPSTVISWDRRRLQAACREASTLGRAPVGATSAEPEPAYASADGSAPNQQLSSPLPAE